MDSSAAEMIPIRLTISIAIVAAIVVMAAIGYNFFSIANAENQIENEFRTLQSSLYSMIGSGVARNVYEINVNEETKRVQTLNLPGNLVYLAFGVDPDPHNNGVLSTGLTENGSMICYQVSGGGKHILWLPGDQMQFREGIFTDDKWVINGDGQGFILTQGGTTVLTFELVQQNSKVYILIHSTDTFN